MTEKSISTILEAKEFFQNLGCSHFHMSKEFPDLYERYKKMKISLETETEWTKAAFYNYHTKLIANEYEKNNLWSIYNKMADLVFILKTESELKVMVNVTEMIKDKIPNHDRFIISETINGHFDNLGLIHLAHDFNNLDLVKAFADLSFYLSDYKFAIMNRKRRKNAYQKTKEVSMELGLRQ